MIPIYADFDGVDQFSPKVAEKYEEAMLNAERNGTHVRAMMLCNPHNPLGQCYPKDTIIALMKLCDKYKVHLLSDEIYASSVYEVPDKNAVKFTSALSFDTSPYISKDYLHVVYGKPDCEVGGAYGYVLTNSRHCVRSEQGFCSRRDSSRMHVLGERRIEPSHELHHSIPLVR